MYTISPYHGIALLISPVLKVYLTKMTAKLNLNQTIAMTWDQAYSQGYRCGEERGFALGWDAAMNEAIVEE
jgi:hypothetical protein